MLCCFCKMNSGNNNNNNNKKNENKKTILSYFFPSTQTRSPNQATTPNTSSSGLGNSSGNKNTANSANIPNASPNLNNNEGFSTSVDASASSASASATDTVTAAADGGGAPLLLSEKATSKRGRDDEEDEVTRLKQLLAQAEKRVTFLETENIGVKQENIGLKQEVIQLKSENEILREEKEAAVKQAKDDFDKQLKQLTNNSTGLIPVKDLLKLYPLEFPIKIIVPRSGESTGSRSSNRDSDDPTTGRKSKSPKTSNDDAEKSTTTPTKKRSYSRSTGTNDFFKLDPNMVEEWLIDDFIKYLTTKEFNDIFAKIEEGMINDFFQELMQMKGDNHEYSSEAEVHGLLYTLFWCPLEHLIKKFTIGNNKIDLSITRDNFPSNKINVVTVSSSSSSSSSPNPPSPPSGSKKLQDPPNLGNYEPDNMIQLIFKDPKNITNNITCRCILELKMDDKFPLDSRPDMCKFAAKLHELETGDKVTIPKEEDIEDASASTSANTTPNRKSKKSTSKQNSKETSKEKAKAAFAEREKIKEQINNGDKNVHQIPVKYAVIDKDGDMFDDGRFNRHIAQWIHSTWYSSLFMGENNCSVRQLFTYMINFGCKYGIITTVNRWYYVMYDTETKKLKIAGVFHGMNLNQSSSEPLSQFGFWNIFIRFLLLSRNYNLKVDQVDKSKEFFEGKLDKNDKSKKNGNGNNPNGGSGPTPPTPPSNDPNGGSGSNPPSNDPNSKPKQTGFGNSNESQSSEETSHQLIDKDNNEENDSTRPYWIGRIYFTDLYDPNWWIPGVMEEEKKKGKLPGNAWIVGEGRTGTVYWQYLHNKEMIIKVLNYARPINDDDEEDKRMDIREEIKNEERIYRILHSLQGDYIPKMYYAGIMREGSHDCVVTSYEGDSLDNIDNIDEIDESFVQDALEALDRIHSLDVLHGDIALRNILRRKKDGKPIIIDFGFSSYHGDVDDKSEFIQLASEEKQKLEDTLRSLVCDSDDINEEEEVEEEEMQLENDVKKEERDIDAKIVEKSKKRHLDELSADIIS